MKKLSLTYRFLRLIGLNYSEEQYGDISLWSVLVRAVGNIYRAFLLRHLIDSALLEPVNPRFLRPKILRWIGCIVGKNVFIGSNIIIDAGHADMIEIEDNVHIAGQVTLLCHQRNLKNYTVGSDYSKLGYKIEKIHLKKGCLVGMCSIIMPGVTIGEGAIVGAGSLVTKSIPDWTIATGRPAIVVKFLPAGEKNNPESEIR